MVSLFVLYALVLSTSASTPTALWLEIPDRSVRHVGITRTYVWEVVPPHDLGDGPTNEVLFRTADEVRRGAALQFNLDPEHLFLRGSHFATTDAGGDFGIESLMIEGIRVQR